VVLGWAALAAHAALGCYSQPKKAYPFAPTPDEERRERIGARVRAFQSGDPSVGVAVGIWHDGRPSVYGYGRTSHHDPRPPNADAFVELGGLGELLVGVLLLELSARKRANLDDPVQAHLPPGVKVPASGDSVITLRQLALHTSGLPQLGAAELERRAPDEPALAALLAKTTLETLPGKRFQPSNLGVAVLAHALAVREGRPIADLLRQRVCEPLGMASTTTFQRSAALDESRLVEGRDLRGQRAPPRFDVPMLTTHALRTTLNDLLRVVVAALSPPADPVTRALHAAVALRRPLGDGTEVAVGWRFDPAHGYLWQVGESAAFRAGVLVDRERGRAVVLAVASAALDARGLLLEIAREETLPSSRTIRPTGHTVDRLPPGSTRADVVLERLVRFAGHQLDTPVARTSESVRVTLYWQCLARIREDLEVTVSAVDEAGRERLRADHYPAGGRYPAHQWRRGELVVDVFDLAVPADLDAGRLTLYLGLRAGGRDLRPDPGPDADISGRIRGPSVEITRR
jgi:CubicO group peptidase (beta-lactamase class C family)